MKFANVRELKNKTSEILRKAEKEDVVITSNGKPRAIITAMTEEDFEDYFLGKKSAFIKVRGDYYKNSGLGVDKYPRIRKSKRR